MTHRIDSLRQISSLPLRNFETKKSCSVFHLNLGRLAIALCVSPIFLDRMVILPAFSTPLLLASCLLPHSLAYSNPDSGLKKGIISSHWHSDLFNAG